MELLLLQTTNRKWYVAHWIAALPISFADLKSHSCTACLFKCIFVQLCSIWQDFNWQCIARSLCDVWAIAIAYSMGQIIKRVRLCPRVRVFICMHSHASISWWIFIKIGTDVLHMRSKNLPYNPYLWQNRRNSLVSQGIRVEEHDGNVRV